MYFDEGKIISEHGNVKVYEYDNDLLLEIGPSHNIWALGSEIKDYMDQLKDLPKGSVLEIGLGLGVVSRYILSLPYVTDLTTIEINSNVIKAYKDLLDIDTDFIKRFGYKDHNIINKNGLDYIDTSDKKFDFIFLDFYDVIDEDTLPVIKRVAKKSKKLLKTNGRVMGWFDPYTPLEFIDDFYEVFS
jgi:spermidine synthase